VAHLYGEWIRNALLVVFAVGAPRVAPRLGWRWTWLVAGAVTVASAAWLHLRYGDPVLGWRTFVVAGAAAAIVLVVTGSSSRDDGGAAPQPPPA
jgi:hypothetical protein